jgi:hypothetical protein
MLISRTTQPMSNGKAVKRLRLAAAVVASAFVAGAAANDASAGQYWSSGLHGAYSTYGGVCQYLNAWNQYKLGTRGPLVYAYNSTYQRESQYVRYAVYLVNPQGTTIRWTGFSNWLIAFDDSPAQLPTFSMFENVPQGSVLDLRIEWWTGNGVAAVAWRITTYALINGAMGNGIGSSCA